LDEANSADEGHDPCGGRYGTRITEESTIRPKPFIEVGGCPIIWAHHEDFRPLERPRVKILVTGADGYIGALMAPYLMARGHDVTGFDVGFYRSGWLYNDLQPRPCIVTRDIRLIERDDLLGYDAVVHLAELSNDPLGEHDRENTFDVNHRGSMRVAEAAKAAGVRRFVYASSCSVYGAGAGEIKSETSAPNPQTAYAECKVLCERGLVDLADTNFTITCLRNATAFGASPRMRFDVVLNNLAGLAWTAGEIAMESDGTPWRPLVHVLDICRAFELVLEAPAEQVQGQIINVGADDQNYQIQEIARIVQEVFPECTISFGTRSADNRSYRVSFAKIPEILPGYACNWSADRGVRQLRAVFESVAMDKAVFDATPFTRLKQLKQLLATKQIDGRLFWRPVDQIAEASRPLLQVAE
jgi:nucleoside-diphosphate-sugar epimerase